MGQVESRKSFGGYNWGQYVITTATVALLDWKTRGNYDFCIEIMNLHLWTSKALLVISELIFCLIIGCFSGIVIFYVLIKYCIKG